MAERKDIIVNLDISQVGWGPGGVDGFFWPYRREELVPALGHLLDTLLPVLQKYCNEERGAGRALGLMIKWLLADMLRIFEASVLAARFRHANAEAISPGHYDRLRALCSGEKPTNHTFLRLAHGPGGDGRLLTTLKRLVREVQWNGFKSQALWPGGSAGERVAVSPTSLTLRHASEKGAFLRYEQLGRWFGPMPEDQLFAPLDDKDSILTNKVVQSLKEIVESEEVDLPVTAEEYMREWVACATNFIDYHIRQLDLSPSIPSELWTGSVGSSPWLILLEHAVKKRGGKTIAHDHGFGNAHIDQLAHHFTSFNCCDVFYTYNTANVEVKRRELRPELVLCREPARLDAPTTSECKPRSMYVDGSIKRLMYVPTAFHGEGARFRPLISDIAYFDWQIRLLTFLRDQEIDVIYKPHPEGRSHPPAGFAEWFGFTTASERFENIREPVDAYLIDFCASSTTATILCSGRPVIYIDPGYPELLPEARSLLERRCKVIRAWDTRENRLEIFWSELAEILEADSHSFDTAFTEKYYAK